MIRNFSKYLKILHIYGLKSVTVIAVIHDADNSSLHFTVHIFINRIKLLYPDSESIQNV